jgi:hypothetical protein
MSTKNLVRAAATALFAITVSAATGCSAFFSGGARTLMPETQVADLTTCTSGDLASIKKNLVLAGYSVKSQDNDMIETEFKQVDGYGTQKELEKIMVVKDGQKAKFRVRVREEGVQKVETGRVQDSQGRTVATDSQLVSTQNEADEKYFNEARQQYEARKKNVCGL